ncbi:DUF6886 family protein [Lentzea sp. NPDC042327]|uniref:DUF6886 family protein n=1 Tax=Lentzea sp. NPDC042327 TaxID=3154801 RepID=UPI0033DA429A
MRPERGQVLHFSEDPAITRFVPHLAATARQSGEYVWAVDAERSPDHWFPRQCPRVLAWVVDGTTAGDRDRVIGPGCGDRVHAVEYGWLERMRTVVLYAYRFDAGPFRPFGEQGEGPGHAVVATVPVEPLGPPERVGDLFELHEEAEISLRVLPALQPFWAAVRGRTLGWSGIRLGNARQVG